MEYILKTQEFIKENQPEESKMHSTSRREAMSDIRSLTSSNHETPGFEGSNTLHGE